MALKKTILLFIITLGFLTIGNAQPEATKMEPAGIYEQIDIARHNAAVEILTGDNKELKQQTVEAILKNPNYYNPPVIYALSRELFNQDKKEEAAYWFYVAQLRARYDSNLCMDNSAKQVVSILNNEYGPDINKYAFQDINKLEKIVTKVVDFVRNNQEDYDHRWVNLHGMDAMLGSMDESSEKKELSQPKAKWAAIKITTVNDYYNGFMEYVKGKK